MSAEKKLTTKIFRVLAAWFINVITALFGEERTKYLTALGSSAWAANNSVNVGMTETAEVLNALLAQPGTEQIYTTQPAWDFNEEQSYRLGSYVDIDGEGHTDTPIYDDGWSDPAEGYTRYPIPSLIYDTDGNAHVVFPVWSWLAADGFRFRPMDMPFRHNCNYLGGGLDGFLWQVVEGSAYTPLEGDTHLTFRTENAVKVGSWCKFTDENSKVYYGFVSAVIPDGDYESVTIIGVGFESDGSEITKVELYKPLQG